MALVIEVSPHPQGVLKTLWNRSKTVAVQVIKDWRRLTVCFRLSIKFKKHTIVEAKRIQNLLKLWYVSFPIRDDDGQSNLIWQIRDYAQLPSSRDNADLVLGAFHDYAISSEK